MDELVNNVGEELKRLLIPGRKEDARIVQSGLMLYRQGLVMKVKIGGDHIVTGHVQDVTPVKVELDLKEFEKSTCTCPSETICRHRLAVFFSLYGKGNSVSNWVSDWKQSLLQQEAMQKWELLRSTNQMKQKEPDYDQWVETIDRLFNTTVKEKRSDKPHTIFGLLHVYFREIKTIAPVRSDWKHLFLITVYSHTYLHLLKLPAQYGHNMKEYTYLFSFLIEQMEQLLEKNAVFPFSAETFFERLQQDLRKVFSNNDEAIDEPLMLYTLVWEQLFKKAKWRQTEKDHLVQLLQQNKTVPLMIGTIFQCMLIKDDKTALELIDSLKEKGILYVITFASRLNETKEWKRMALYSNKIVQYFPPYLHKQTDTNRKDQLTDYVINLMTPFAEATKRFDLLERIMVKTLPYSYEQYEEFLYINEEYEKWVDLHMYVGIFDSRTIASEKIAKIQKKHPELLLPLFHHSIEEDIQMKNRIHYREAVQKLLTLKAIYKKQKREDVWEQFFTTLLQRTKRMRAFHEECRRGKLLQ